MDMDATIAFTYILNVQKVFIVINPTTASENDPAYIQYYQVLSRTKNRKKTNSKMSVQIMAFHLTFYGF